jgi:hypothetical protein
MRTAPAIFGRTPGARPAVVGGLINGVAIGTPLLVGAASGEPAAGALTCIGAYIAAFTNEGGQRWSRTTGLVMASIVNTAAFAVGAVAPRLFPLDVAVFAALVFIASMGAVFGATVARCGTMPPTAFLSGVYLTEHESVAASVLLFAVGGLWYAVATMALTPAPRLRSLMATIGAAYSKVAVSVADETKGLTTNRSQVETALRAAEQCGTRTCRPRRRRRGRAGGKNVGRRGGRTRGLDRHPQVRRSARSGDRAGIPRAW